MIGIGLATRLVGAVVALPQRHRDRLPGEEHALRRLGQQLGVNGTPTFYINGIKVPSLRPAYFDAAIEYLLKKQG